MEYLMNLFLSINVIYTAESLEDFAYFDFDMSLYSRTRKCVELL